MAALGYIAAIVFSTVLNGFVLTVLWGWFVIRVFGVRAISIPEALGLAMVASFLTHQYHEDKRSLGEILAYAFISGVLSLALGWVIQLFL